VISKNIFKAGSAIAAISFLLVWVGCTSSSSSSGGPTYVQAGTSATYLNATGANVMSITIGSGTICGQAGYPNEPCTSVKICSPGSTTNCQTITDLLVDTGSVGLRVFKSALTLSPSLTYTADTTISGNTIAECAQFGTGADWGPLATVDIYMGTETTPATVPMQVIDQTFATVPSVCSQGDTSPTEAGFNGILGVGLFNDDCGSTCATDAAADAYYTCPTSGACTAITRSTSTQVLNPVSNLSQDNNGVIIALPAIPAAGSASVTGALILGINSQTNNVPTGVSGYYTDADGNFETDFGGSSITGSFLDTGSNALFFPSTSLTQCGTNSAASGFYCPSAITTLSAVNHSNTGTSTATVTFQVSNAVTLVSGSNQAFYDLAGNISANDGFDWGLPFYYGRAVFFGIQSKSSTFFGTGPYVGY